MKKTFVSSLTVAILLITAVAAPAQSQQESLKEYLLRKEKLKWDFFDAIAKSDTAACERLLKAEAGLEDKNYAGNTPLVEAAIEGNLKMVEWLLDHGAKVDQPGYLDMTPAMRAAIKGHQETLRRLTAAGADDAIKDSFGLTLQDWIKHPGIIETLKQFDAQLAGLNATSALFDESDRHMSSEARLKRFREDFDGFIRPQSTLPKDYNAIRRREMADLAVSTLLLSGARAQELRNQDEATIRLFQIASDARQTIQRPGANHQSIAQALPRLFRMHAYRQTAGALEGLRPRRPRQ